MAFPHATPGYIPSPLQSPYFAAAAAANPLAHINPAIMFPTAVTSAVTEPQSVAMVNTTDSSRSVQMQAALLQQVQPGQFHAAAAQAAAQAQAAHHAGQPHHHPHLQLQQHQHHHHHGHQQKANKGDRAEVKFFHCIPFATVMYLTAPPTSLSRPKSNLNFWVTRVTNGKTTFTKTLSSSCRQFGNFCFPAKNFFLLCLLYLFANFVLIGCRNCCGWR